MFVAQIKLIEGSSIYCRVPSIRLSSLLTVLFLPLLINYWQDSYQVKVRIYAQSSTSGVPTMYPDLRVLTSLLFVIP